MPTYQYACTACGESLEAVQAFSDPALTECPACQGRLRKVYSAVGVVFKGSGFYKTDSRSGAAKGSGEGASSSSSGGGETSSGRSGESTVAAKTESSSTSKTETKSASTSSSSASTTPAA